MTFFGLPGRSLSRLPLNTEQHPGQPLNFNRPLVDEEEGLVGEVRDIPRSFSLSRGKGRTNVTRTVPPPRRVQITHVRRYSEPGRSIVHRPFRGTWTLEVETPTREREWKTGTVWVRCKTFFKPRCLDQPKSDTSCVSRGVNRPLKPEYSLWVFQFSCRLGTHGWWVLLGYIGKRKILV